MNEEAKLIQTPKLALNRVEAAEALSVSPATLDRLANRGLILPCRATGRPLYSIKEIERFLSENTPLVAQGAGNRGKTKAGIARMPPRQRRRRAFLVLRRITASSMADID